MWWPPFPQCVSTEKLYTELSSGHGGYHQLHQRPRGCAESLQESGEPNNGGHPPPYCNKRDAFDGVFPPNERNMGGPAYERKQIPACKKMYKAANRKAEVKKQAM